MNTNRIIRKPWVAGLVVLVLAAPLSLSLQGCTDLDEEVFGSVTADNFYRTEEEVTASLAPVYAQLRSALGGYHNVTEVSSDEVVVPTRGSDWYDGGAWLALHRQTWSATHGDLNGAWVDAYTGVARANVVLQTLENSNIPNKERLFAELRALRAFYYYELMDFFGGVPLVGFDMDGDGQIEWTVDPKNPPARATRKQVFETIESELIEAREALPEQWEGGSYGRMTKGACDAMLANMYLNAEVFTGEVTAGGLVKGTARWGDAVTAADRLLNSSQYRLATNWFDNFTAGNGAMSEHIFVVAHLGEDGLGLNFIHRALHYNQFTPSPWNGFATLAETYNAFSDDDMRKQIFLVGQAYNVETGEPVNNRQNEPLVFTPEIADVTQATEGEGARIYKFPADPAHTGPDNGNDYPFFRLAEMYLIKAEALNEQQGPNQTSIDLLNQLRQRVFAADKFVPLRLSDFGSKEALRDRILQERLYELTYEAKRRQDLVRHGKFNNAWSFKEASAPYRIVFPVPQTQLDANPNLAQNAGY